MTQLNEACNEGDQDEKSAIEDLAPEMAVTLKKLKEWDRPKSCLTALPKQLSVLSQFEQIKKKDVDVLVEQLVTSRLGPMPEADPVNDS